MLGQPEPHRDMESAAAFLLRNRIALWDVLQSCDIYGAADGSIANPVANRFAPLMNNSAIRAVFATGKAATDLFNKLCAEEVGMRAAYLPSTSPANRAAHGKPEFMRQWMQVADVLELF